MGLKSTIQNAVNSAFSALGASSADGVNQAISYLSVTSAAVFDPATGAVTAATGDILTFDAIVYDVETGEVDNERIKVGDRRVIFPVSVVPDAYEPQLVDKVTIDSIEYLIKDYSQDPAGATWTLLIRSPNA